MKSGLLRTLAFEIGAGGLLVLIAVALVPARLEARLAPMPVIDLHVDLSYRSLYEGSSFARGSGEFRSQDLLQGGVAGVVLPLFVPKDAEPAGRTREQFERSYSWVFGEILRTPPYSLPGCGVLRAGKEARSVETWLAFEGSGPLADSDDEVGRWILRGVRVFGVVHSEHNRLATSSGESATAEGLSARGKRFVRRVFDHDAIVDVSHASDRSIEDTIAIAREVGGVVVATHSNARRLAPHPRNLSDAQIRMIAETGGVIGVNFHQTFLDPVTRRADLGEVARVMRYVARLAGDEAVAIGSDFEGGIRPAKGLETALAYQNLAQALSELGVEESRIRAYFSGNARRVLCATPRPPRRGDP